MKPKEQKNLIVTGKTLTMIAWIFLPSIAWLAYTTTTSFDFDANLWMIGFLAGPTYAIITFGLGEKIGEEE